MNGSVGTHSSSKYCQLVLPCRMEYVEDLTSDGASASRERHVDHDEAMTIGGSIGKGIGEC